MAKEHAMYEVERCVIRGLPLLAEGHGDPAYGAGGGCNTCDMGMGGKRRERMTGEWHDGRATRALTLSACAQGLIKSSVYGLLVALAGCLRGMQCGRSAAAVGQATTSAVVTSIVCIISASAILMVIFFRV